MAGSQRAGRSLSVYPKGADIPPDPMELFLAGVVGDIIERPEFDSRKDPAKDFTDDQGQHLPVCQGHIDRRIHCPDVLLSGGRADRGAGKFPVGQYDSSS